MPVSAPDRYPPAGMARRRFFSSFGLAVLGTASPRKNI